MTKKKIKKKQPKNLYLTELEALTIHNNQLEAEIIKHKLSISVLQLALRNVEHEKQIQLLERQQSSIRGSQPNHASTRTGILDAIRDRLKFDGDFSYDPDTLEVFLNSRD